MTKTVTRPLGDKSTYLDARPKRASFVNGHLESNWTCTEVQTGAAARAAGSPAAIKSTIEQHVISS
jgi:hypothetical protein